jgi:subtilase family serine protease
MNIPWVGVRRVLPGLLFLLLINTNSTSAQAPARVLEAVDNAQRITLLGNVHPLARPEYDRGAVSGSQAMNRILLLLKRSGEQEAELQTYMEEQQDKSSPNYHVWLTPQEFGAQYGVADADIQAVTQWLTSQGFSIGKVYSNKTIIEFSGSAAQVQSAFGTAIHNYEVNGKMYVANASNPQIPAALAPVITGIVSLNNFPRQSYVRVAGTAKKIPGQPGVQPLFTFPNPFGSGNFYALAPGDFATIYNSKGLIASGNDGTAQTIAIVGETNINVSDVQAFRQLFGLSANFTTSNVILNGPDPGITSVGEEGEADLDVQWSGAVAPGATIELVVSASTSTSAGIDLSALYIIENNLAGEMSESYGDCESGLGAGGNAFYNALWEQAAAQGITVILSAGDGGSAGCDDFDTATVATQGLAVSGMASTPYNVALGGTDFDDVNTWSTYWSASNISTGSDIIGTSALSYIPEIPWNQNCAQISLTFCGSGAPKGSVNIIAGSGGPSSVYSKPSWQLGVTGMPNDSHRDLPDLSLFASAGFDFSGYIVCQADAYAGNPCSIITPGGVNVQIVGGTSASAPTFAGIMALLNQYQSSHGGTSRQGNANYVLYALAKKTGASCTSSATEAKTCIFNDVTHGNTYIAKEYGSSTGTNSVPCQGGTPNCSVTVASETGALVEPASPSTEAWTATGGYDLTTGLGSVNVANLITNWGSVSTVPTTTTLSVSPTQNITHGSNEDVSVDITVTPKSGTATGNVSLIATLTGSSGTTQQGLAQYTLTSGSFSGSTDSLPGGSYTVTAHYAGDGTNAPSDSSPPIPITVSAESSKTFANLVTLNANGVPTNFTASTATYGSGYAVFRVDVGDSAATVSSSSGISSNCSKASTTCPTGTVTLSSSGTTPLPTSSMVLNVLGYGETPFALSPGSYSVTANYPGDASYGASSTTANFSIAQAPVTLVAQADGMPAQLGTFDPLTAELTTTSDGVEPTGTVQFAVDGTPIGNPVPVSEGNGYIPGGNPPNYAWADAVSGTSFNAIGNHILTAQYSGDTNYAAAASSPFTVVVGRGLPSLTAGANPSSINLGQKTTLIAQVSGTVANLAPSGTVAFFNGTAAISGTVTYSTSNETLTATMPYTPLTAGTYAINASYSGDSNYLTLSTSVGGSLTVTGPDFSLTPQPPFSSVSPGGSAAYTVAVAAIDGFSGKVNFACSITAAAGVTCTANPSSVAVGGSTTITVSTTALVPPTPSGRSFRPWPIVVLFSLFLALSAALLAYSKPVQIGRRFVFGTIFMGLILVALMPAGCGGGGGGGKASGTPAGTYNVTITGTSGSLSHTVSVILTVQ